MLLKTNILTGYIRSGLYTNKSVLFGSSLVSELTRYFTDYSASLQSYDEFSTPITLSGDFRLEFSFATTDAATPLYICGNSSFDGFIQLRHADAGGARIFADSSTSDFTINSQSVNEFFNGKLNVFAIERISDTFNCYINDDLIGSTTNSGFGTFSFSFTGRAAGNYHNFSGEHFKAWDAGTLVGDFPLDEGPDSTIRINRAAVPIPSLNIGTAVTWVNDGGSTYNQPSSSGSLLPIGGSAGQTYRFTGIVNTNNVFVNNGVTNLLLALGSNDVIIKAGTQPPRLIGSLGCSITITSLDEIPAATPYATRFNQPASLTNLFTQVSDGWECEEQEPQPFNVSSWTATTGATLIPPNHVRLDSTVAGMFRDYGITGVHRIIVDAESDATTLQMKDSPTGSGAGPDILVANPMSQTIDYDFTSGGIYFRNIGAVNDVCTINQLSVKRFIEVAS